MTYATRSDMEARFGLDEIAHRADPDGSGADRIAAALADAAAEIDSVLAVAYDLPLPAGTYPALRAIACDLARDRLYDDAALDEPKARRKAAAGRLEALRDGRMFLVSGEGVTAPRRSRVGVSGPRPVMTRESLGGFGGGADAAIDTSGGA